MPGYYWGEKSWFSIGSLCNGSGSQLVLGVDVVWDSVSESELTWQMFM